MSQRAARPLNSDACSQADKDLYSRHENDERPNALYDDNGDRKKLDPNDPGQSDLRTEWMGLYSKHGGQIEPSSSNTNKDRPADSNKKPDDPVEPCPLLKDWIRFRLVRKERAQPTRSPDPQTWWPSDVDLPYGGEHYVVNLSDNVAIASTLDGGGEVQFDGIPVGVCQIKFPAFYDEIEAYFSQELQ